jgi:hypothetical protein
MNVKNMVDDELRIKCLNAFMDAPYENEFCPFCLKDMKQVPRQGPFAAALQMAFDHGRARGHIEAAQVRKESTQ